MANFGQNTRYTNGTITKNRSNEDFLILRRPLNLEPGDSDQFVSVPQHLTRRPDLISNLAYGNPDLWWVIYEFNGIHDPLFGLPTGTILRIPAIDRVLEAIQEL